MLDSKWSEGTRRYNLQGLAVKERRARIFRLFVEIVSKIFQTAFKALLVVGCADLQDYGVPTPTCRHRQSLHDRLNRRDQQHGLFRSGETPQHRASPACDLPRRIQSIERQGVQSWKHQHIERWVKRMQHAA